VVGEACRYRLAKYLYPDNGDLFSLESVRELLIKDAERTRIRLDLLSQSVEKFKEEVNYTYSTGDGSGS
jgi:hypothetical protein